ncbi:tryptophan synthase subunit beta [Pseudomonas sp. GOM6]|uniref:tryptophan synthase subunit beta n=1 Tax=Pseudomonas sp. GOM6 TaxID=3036944 RepID=UPI0024098716|nr:tryptophan synthase subunit beta [Pseudomonas sp. GOM6]MDG1583236.1 tryptophan synthase subunit beta [Pseudomonas sp. GOM6]
MVYVQRDAEGRLLRVEHDPFEGMNETLAVESEELHRWIAAREEVRERLASLKDSDLELVRVLEDVVTALVSKGVIRYTDLPEAARRKLDQRAVTRAEIEGLSGLLGDDDHHLI